MSFAAQEASGSNPTNEARDTLAYEHAVSVELDKETLPERLREIEAACKADSASSCTIIESALRWRERLPSASIRMRLAPGAVEGLITLASRDGKMDHGGRQRQSAHHAHSIARPGDGHDGRMYNSPAQTNVTFEVLLDGVLPAVK